MLWPKRSPRTLLGCLRRHWRRQGCPNPPRRGGAAPSRSGSRAHSLQRRLQRRTPSLRGKTRPRVERTIGGQRPAQETSRRTRRRPVNADPARIPVIVGVGQVNDRPVAEREGMDSIDLMVTAARAADEDAGGGFIAMCDWLACVPQISFRETQPGDPASEGARHLAPHRPRRDSLRRHADPPPQRGGQLDCQEGGQSLPYRRWRGCAHLLAPQSNIGTRWWHLPGRPRCLGDPTPLRADPSSRYLSALRERHPRRLGSDPGRGPGRDRSHLVVDVQGGGRVRRRMDHVGQDTGRDRRAKRRESANRLSLQQADGGQFPP